MVNLREVEEIEIDMKVYRNEKILFRGKDGRLLGTIVPKPGMYNEVYKKIAQQWEKVHATKKVSE